MLGDKPGTCAGLISGVPAGTEREASLRLRAQMSRYLLSNTEALIRPEYPNNLRIRIFIAPAIYDSATIAAFDSASD
jgi:hypothetical protein